MDTLHQMAHTKSPETTTPVCGMSGYEFASMAHKPSNTITCLAGGDEMLRVTPEGFWVRGVKVAQDDKEAEVVYNAFKAWMTWAQLHKDYK
jgi:hypothetical protein